MLYDDLNRHEAIERPLALYVSRDLAWGNWRPSRGEAANLERALADLGVIDRLTAPLRG